MEASQERVLSKNFFNLIIIIGTLIGVGYLIYYGIQKTWWNPFIIIVIGAVLSFVFERLFKTIFKKPMLKMISLLGIVVFGILMFVSIPL